MTVALRARSSGERVVYALGPIEGRYDRLADALERIVADIAARPEGAPPLLVFIGNHLGPETAEVMSALVWLSRHPVLEVCALRGGHEAALLACLAGDDGGGEMLDAVFASYGADAGELIDAMPASHLELLRAMPEMATCGDYAFAWRRAGAGAAKTIVHGEDAIATPEAIGLLDPDGLAVLRLERASATFLRDGPTPQPVVVEDEVDDEPEGEGAPTMRTALRKLRPGY